MSLAQSNISLNGLARYMVSHQLLSEEIAVELSGSATKTKTPFIKLLLEEKHCSAQEVATAASVEFGIPLFDLNAIDYEVLPKEVIDEKLIRKHHALPLFKRGKRLFVAVYDPTNLLAVDEFQFHSKLTVETVLAEYDKLGKYIDKFIDDQESQNLSEFDDADLDNLDIESGEKEEKDEGGTDADDAPIVRFVNKILLDAIKKGASDLHFEPYEKSYRVRFRIDGILHEVSGPPINLSSRIAARLKVMSRLDISERRVPQDGRIKLKLSKNKAIDFRVSTLPTLFGEKIVMRILDPSSAMLGIEVLGYEPEQRELFENALFKPQGMVLVTGPTGSGKTVSLYTGVNMLNKPETNISTAEDPVEINLAGVNQVNVNPKAGLDFSSALRAFLRQDPDVILVGEIRDLETAEIAIKAAQTGHMVLSTLHTNSAPETLTRLVNMGVQPFNIATSVNLVIAQRLARRLCEVCKKKSDIPKEAQIQAGFDEESIGNFEIFEPVGCDQCTNGYKGRVGIYQVMPVTEEMGRIIMEGGNAIDIADQASKDGVNDLRQSGLLKIQQGITSLAEINRVTQD